MGYKNIFRNFIGQFLWRSLKSVTYILKHALVCEYETGHTTTVAFDLSTTLE
ncbi:hypothetical protein [Rhodohalobacter sp. 8-1]|uniref:hypothetical protein n=1 Tax=Rhodohalobacter sp. 8-1 TaxID=3131972 RepID=UPI0030ED5862